MTDGTSLNGFGARLKAAREALHLSQKEAATRLHLPVNILHSLETEDLQKAPPATFMRGYLRSYARLLNFSEEEINQALNQSNLEFTTSAPIIPMLPADAMPLNDRYVQWISTIVIIALVIFVGIWWGLHSQATHHSMTQIIKPENTPQTPAKANLPSTTLATATLPASSTATAISTETQNLTHPFTAAQSTAIMIAGTATTAAASAVLQQFNEIKIADSERDKKSSRRHEKQNNKVSGVAMALPEPGL